jgi:signal transduction histidine kinase
VPVFSREKVIAVVRAERSLRPIDHRTRVTWAWMLILAGTVLVLAALAAIGLARRLVRPVAELADAATRLGDGDFAIRTARSGIGEVDRAAAALDSTAERLGAVLERERSFSADASHQLRTPLTALRVHLAAATDAAGPAIQADLAAAMVDVDRLERTVNDLIALARDVSVADDVDLPGLLADAEQVWAPRFAEARRRLVVSAPEAPPTLRASRPAIDQVLEVLLTNAERHGQGTVTVAIRDIPAGLALEVSDEGDGVDGDPDAVFTRRGTGAAGHGIGLALARSLAEAEGGRLFLRTDTATTTFALLFPSVDG